MKYFKIECFRQDDYDGYGHGIEIYVRSNSKVILDLGDSYYPYNRMNETGIGTVQMKLEEISEEEYNNNIKTNLSLFASTIHK